MIGGASLSGISFGLSVLHPGLASLAIKKMLPAPMLLGGLRKYAAHFVAVFFASYFSDFRDQASKMGKPELEPLVALQIAMPTLFHSSQPRLFGITFRARSSSSASACGSSPACRSPCSAATLPLPFDPTVRLNPNSRSNRSAASSTSLCASSRVMYGSSSCAMAHGSPPLQL